MADLKSALEAILFAAGESISAERISLVMGIELDDVLRCARELKEEYERDERGIRLLFLDKKLQLCSAPEYATYITRTLEQRKPPMLSQSALETLAIVAYFQPVTRAYIDQVRGVDSAYTVSSLLERGLIEISGKLEAPGRPSLLVTTDVFLRTMGVSKLDELPRLPDMSGGEGVLALQRKIEELQSNGGSDQISIEELSQQIPEEEDSSGE